MTKRKSPCILYVSTFPPRECGIATFTSDLSGAINKEFGAAVKCKVLAVNENGTSIYNYPRKVIMQINETEIEDYLNRAKQINKSSQIKLVNIQHEYGIFGGDWGNYLLPFLEILTKPVIVTFHTVLPKPKEKLKKLTQSIAQKANSIVVMTQSAANLLETIYKIDRSKIMVIPHGVPHIAYPSKTRAKKNLSLSGRTVLSTFGMLNSDKGIEYAISALPEVVKEFPNLIYLIVGETHPVVRRGEGEAYRNKLKKLVIKLGLKNHVKFYNKYVTLAELLEYLKATDIYLSPTLNPVQAVSGTVSYAFSCACPVIVTANEYAKGVMTPDRGTLVRFRNSLDIKKALLSMLSDRKMTRDMGRNAYFYSRHMTWQNVALSYFKTFNKYAKIIPRQKDKLPSINLDHIKALTDNFGIIQFATHTKPDIHSGYCLDDNSRILLGLAIYYKDKPLKSILNLIDIYLKFVKFVQKSNGKFSNFVNHSRRLGPEGESEDSFGRVIWALGHLISNDHLPDRIRKKAQLIFKKAIKWAPDLKSSRAIAFTILGLCYLIQTEDDNHKIYLIKRLADKLIRRYNKTCQATNNEWPWFEDYLTYSNYKLPEALMRAYQVTGNKDYLKIAESALKFITKVTFEKNDYFSAIGQNGWYFRGGKRSYFDQQPEDAASAVEGLVAAWQITKKKTYTKQAKLAYEWFLGKNHLNQMIYDEATGGCYDGLGKDSINFNQGAESTICYFLARLAIQKIK